MGIILVETTISYNTWMSVLFVRYITRAWPNYWHIHCMYINYSAKYIQNVHMYIAHLKSKHFFVFYRNVLKLYTW